MTYSIVETNAPLATPSSSIVLNPKIRKCLEPIFEALRQAQRQTGRFRYYGYLTAVYRTHKEWKDRGISKQMARRLAEQFLVPRRKDTSPMRTLIDATHPALDPKVKSRWSRALEFAAAKKVAPENLQELFKASAGIAGCARSATERDPKKSKNAWI
jgi:hypothetical protein